MAGLAHGFFGISDGPVIYFDLAKTSPHADGRFDVDLPMISREATRSEPQASVSTTLNHIASNLEPDDPELRSEDRCLQTRTSYPTEMKFTALHFKKSTLKGKVFRSDSGEPISTSYILLASEKDQEKHFDTRTDEAGNCIFGRIPAGRYKVSIYAWFGKRDELPCQNPRSKRRRMVATSRSNGNGRVTHSWKSSRSKAFL